MNYRDYFWCLLFLLGICVITVGVVLFRSFVLGYSSSHIFLYLLLFTFIFCLLCLYTLIQNGEKTQASLAQLLFYYIFSVIFCLCLLSVSDRLLGIDLLSAWRHLEENFVTLSRQLGLPLHISLQKDFLSVLFALSLGLLPVSLVMCAFRYGMLIEFGSKSLLSAVATHLPLLIILLSIPAVSLDRFEGRMIGGVL